MENGDETMKNPSKQKTLAEYLDAALELYKLDPADSDYQEGYENCLKDLKISLTFDYFSGLK